MASYDFYVDSSKTPASPWYKHMLIEPFGRTLGVENTSFLQYEPTDVSAFFDVDPASVDSCPMSNSCDPQEDLSPGASSRLGGLLARGRFAESTYELAARRAHAVTMDATAADAAAAAARRDPPPPPNVTFGSDYSAMVDGLLEIAQGARTAANGDPCCVGGEPDSPQQCQVQVQHFRGPRYHDVTNQRERFEDAVGAQTTVDDYTTHMSMLINVTDGVETCAEWCPIDASDKLHPLEPFDPLDTVRDFGSVLVDGKTLEHFRWSDVILKVIKMQTTDFYADIADPANAVPYLMTTQITPFGTAPIGFENHTYSQWAAGTPPADKFKIAGVQQCPRSNKCGSQDKQAHRMRSRQLHTFYRYHKA